MGLRVFEWLVDNVMVWVVSALFILLALLVFVALPVALYRDAQRPTFELKKGEWSCVQSHTETSTTYIQSGKVLVPSTSTRTVCDVYARQ